MKPDSNFSKNENIEGNGSKGPNFLYIGSSRAGSTWLYRVLTQHPQIFLPQAKSLYFFDREYSRGVGWYEKFFKDSDFRHTAIGEITHDYIFCEEGPRRICKYNPRMKFIVNLRDPIERLISYYQFFSKRAGWNFSSIHDFIKRWPVALEEGYYAKHLKRYLSFFKPEQFCIFDFNLIGTNPRRYLEHLFSFLGCATVDFEESFLNEKVWASKPPLFKPLNRLLNIIAIVVREMGFPNFMARVKYSGWADRILFRDGSVSTLLLPEEREKFFELYQSEMQALSELIPTLPHCHGEFSWIENYR